VAPEVVTTLQPGINLPPISRILSLNFSFHALNAANISCIAVVADPVIAGWFIALSAKVARA
jgi:hypothetical protein